MEKHSAKVNRTQIKIQKASPLNFIYSLILLAYGYITVLTPNLMAFDSNGPKFMTIALLNLVVFAYLFTRKEVKQNPNLTLGFFKSGAGLFYALLMVVSLLSFVKAINVLESILHFCKIFTVFSAAYLVSVIVLIDRRHLNHLAIGMTALLLFDDLSVFYNINQYIKGKLSDISLIKTVYSNKNILAASIFVKIPFALWLITFDKGWKRVFAYVSAISGLLATLFLSTRSFYLGTFGLTIAYAAYILINYLREKQKKELRLIMTFGVALVSVFLIFTLTQQYLYPKKSGIYDVGVTQRLSSISSTEESSNKRITAWERSFNCIKKDPLLGVGLGNWKVATLQEENQTNPDYIYQYKAHNDFIETTTEVGIFGGLFFIAIFLFVIGRFFRAAIRHEDSEDIRYLFLPAFGMMAYFFDAFFNFPQDRPEIQALFALMAGTGIAFTQLSSAKANDSSAGLKSENDNLVPSNVFSRYFGSYVGVLEKNGSVISKVFSGILISLLLGSAYILILNFQSLKLQRIIKDEMMQNKLTRSSDEFVNGFPWIPDINVVGEPIAAQKARYLINEKKYDKAIALLKKDHSSPYDTRPEYFIAMAYFNQGKNDSALLYNQKVYEYKPMMFENISMMCASLERLGRSKEALPILENYLKTQKTNNKAWVMATQFYNNIGDLKNAASCIDLAYQYLPSDTLISKRRDFQRSRVLIAPYADLFSHALTSYQTAKYDEALVLLTEFINKEPNLPEVYEYRAFSNYFTKHYEASLKDLDKMFSFGIRRANLLNLRGVNLQSLGRADEACTFYKEAMLAGNKDGATNYKQFCEKRTQTVSTQQSSFNPLLIKK